MKQDDAEGRLLEAAQAGDRAALDELLASHWKPIYHFIQYKTGHSHDAEDIAQETFLRAFRALSRYQETNASFRTYLARIALNLITDHWRRQGRAPKMADLSEYNGLAENREEQPEEAAVRTERRQKVMQALNTLSADQRQVIVLRLIDGLSVNEVARRLNKTEAAIKMLQQRGLAKLRDELRKPH